MPKVKIGKLLASLLERGHWKVDFCQYGGGGGVTKAKK
jgi:hypothetical protein